MIHTSKLYIHQGLKIDYLIKHYTKSKIETNILKFNNHNNYYYLKKYYYF